MIGQIYFSIYKKVTFGDSVHFIKSPAASALSDNKASFTKYMSSENIYRIIPNWTVIPRWELRVIELSLHMDEGQKKSDSLHPLNPWPGSNECGSEERGGERRMLKENFIIIFFHHEVWLPEGSLIFQQRKQKNDNGAQRSFAKRRGLLCVLSTGLVIELCVLYVVWPRHHRWCLWTTGGISMRTWA